MQFAVIDTLIGALTLASTEKGLASIHFGKRVPQRATLDGKANRVCMTQIEEYFQGRRTEFDFPLDFEGTPFQIAV